MTKNHLYFVNLREKYGPILQENYGMFKMVVIWEPEDLEDLFRQDPKYPERFEVEPWLYYRAKKNVKKGVVIA